MKTQNPHSWHQCGHNFYGQWKDQGKANLKWLKLDCKSEEQTNKKLNSRLKQDGQGTVSCRVSADKVDFQATGFYWSKGGIQMGNTAADHQK